MANPTCPANCAAPLPVFSFTDCNPEVFLSEIEWLLLAKPTATNIADMDVLASWSDRVENSGVATADTIRKIRVTGDMPAAAENEQTISGQRRLVVDRTFTINAEVDETGDVNYQALRELQCGGLMKIWPVTRSGHIFGGVTGVLATVKTNLSLARGENEIQKISITATWKSKFFPERDLWPLAGT